MQVEYSRCVGELKRLHNQVLDPHGNIHGAICVRQIKHLGRIAPVIVLQLRPSLHDATIECRNTVFWKENKWC